MTPGTTDITIPAHTLLLNTLTIKAVQTQTKTVTPGKSEKTVTPDSGKYLSSVKVNGDADLIAANIRKAVNIFGVIGTMEEGVPGVDYGMVTVTSNTTSIVVSHTLGKKPSNAFLVPRSIDYPSESDLDKTHFTFNGSAMTVKREYTGDFNFSRIFYQNVWVSNTLSASSITFNPYIPSRGFCEETYYWIAIA